MLALLTDIHSNLEALEACLAHARAQGATRHAFLGDLVGYNADPVAVVERVRDAHAAGAIVVKGNHDEAVEGHGGYLNATAAAAIEWTRQVLSPELREYLKNLPLRVVEGGSCFVHATADRPERWTYVDGPGAAERSLAASGATRVFSGHVHEPALFIESRPGTAVAHLPRAGTSIPIAPGRRWLAIAGSLGQPRDGNPAASYALVDDDGRWIRFHRVPYDHHAAAAKIRAAGLPEALAYRLERGI